MPRRQSSLQFKKSNNPMRKDPSQEALKEFGRVMVSGIIPLTVTIIGLVTTGFDQNTGVITHNWAVIRNVFLVQLLTLLGTALPRAYDKYVHEDRKNNEGYVDGESKGIIPW